MVVTTTHAQGQLQVSEEYQQWWKCDQHVLALINSSLSESVLPIEVRKNSDPSWIMNLHNKLHTINKGTQTLDVYIQDLQETCDERAASSQPVLETVILSALLRGLGPDFNDLTASLNPLLDHLTRDDVVAQICSDDNLLQYQQ